MHGCYGSNHVYFCHLIHAAVNPVQTSSPEVLGRRAREKGLGRKAREKGLGRRCWGGGLGEEA